MTASLPAPAAVITFTNSAAFTAALGGTQHVENFSTGAAGQTIANGGSFDGNVYTTTSGPSGTLLGSIITNQFNSFSGLSLGGNQSGGAQFFFGGDRVTVTFASAVNAVGVFFNVNLGSGSYVLNAAGGTASTGSTAYDTSTFVFDGLISTTPFTSVTFLSADTALGSFNIPEIISRAAVPEPGPATLMALGTLAAFAAARRRVANGRHR